MFYLCVGALVCSLLLGPKHQNKDMNKLLITQVVGEIYLPYICVDALSPTGFHTTEHHNKDTTYFPHGQIISHIVMVP